MKHINQNEKNGQWKGTSVGYCALHDWVKRRIVKPKNCNKCHKERQLDLTNKSGRYLRNLSDWEWLCRQCHMISDGRLEKLNKLTGKIIHCLVCDKEKYVRKSETDFGYGKYCSRSCATKGRWIGLSKGWYKLNKKEVV